MKGSLDKDFKTSLKRLIIEACELDVDTDEIDDESPLFGSSSALGLDSIDGLQIAIAIQNTYGIKITDGKEIRRIMQNINTFADFLRADT